MASPSAMALSSLLLSCLLAGALGGPSPPPVYPPPPPVYPPSPVYPPPSPPVPPPSPASDKNVTGYARFFGPLSAGCNVAYVNGPTGAASSLLGQVSVLPYQTIRVSPGAGCTDLFTGIAIPYNLGGKSPANAPFQVSSTNTIAAASADLAQTAAYSYSKLNVKGALKLETSEIFSVIRTGNSTAWQLLNADLQYILASVVVSNAYVAVSASAAGNTCTNVALAQNAFANYTNTIRSFPIAPSAAASAMLSICNVTNFNQTLVDAIATSAVINTLQVLSAGIPYLSRPPALDLAAMSRWASMLSASSLTALNTMTTGTTTAVQTQVGAALDAAAINPDQIATYLGLAGATVAQATTVRIVGTGPLSNAVATFTPYHTKVSSTLAATVSNDIQTSASTTNPAGYFGFYSVAAGAIDLFLTANFNNPVVSLMPFTGVMGFTTSASSSITLAPISAVVNATWWVNQVAFVNNTANDLNVPSAPGPADWLAAYTTIVGAGLDSSYDYMSRTYPNGSPSQALVMVADALVCGTAGLIGQWINGSIAGSKTPIATASQISNKVFSRLAGLPAAQYANPTVVTSIIRDVYFASGGVVPAPNYGSYGGYYPPPAGTYPPAAYPPPSPAAASGRRSLLSSRHLLQSTTQNPDFDAIIVTLASSIADSNSLITAYIPVIASGSFTRRLLQTSNAAVGTAQVSAVQNQDMANAAAQIAAAIAGGDMATAKSLAATFAKNFGGDALRALVNNKAVNSAAINAATSTGGSSSDNKKKIALGVGLGVGLGVPILAAAIAGIVIFVKNRRAEQTTAPAATAEGVHNVREFAVAPAGNNSVMPTPQEEQIAAYYRNRLAAAGYSS